MFKVERHKGILTYAKRYISNNSSAQKQLNRSCGRPSTTIARHLYTSVICFNKSPQLNADPLVGSSNNNNNNNNNTALQRIKTLVTSYCERKCMKLSLKMTSLRFLCVLGQNNNEKCDEGSHRFTSAAKMKVDKKQEFKDFSLNPDILLNELTEEEISNLFPIVPLKQTVEKKDEAVIAERFVDSAIEQSQRGKTENQAGTYLTSGDPRIDFYFNVLEDTNDGATISLLERSWNYNSLDTLRMIAYLRDIRNGKSIKYQYYVCLYWLYEHHPQTLLKNVNILLNCGYWKDPLQLLMVILFKGQIPKYLFQEERNVNSTFFITNKRVLDEKKKMKKKEKSESKSSQEKPEMVSNMAKSKFIGQFYKKGVKSEINELLVKYYKEEIDKKYRPLKTRPGEVSNRRSHEIKPKHLKELQIRFARERFNSDKKYRHFHLKFAGIFAKQLIEDVGHLKDNNAKMISLAAKWAPSLNGHFDKYTLIGSSIALQIVKLTRAEDPSLEEIFTKPTPIATYLARKHYHKNYIVNLREELQIPELYMCKNEWNLLPYKMVPSKCMQNNRELFMKFDYDRFEEFVKSSKTISGGTLKPPELIKRAMTMSVNAELDIELLEKQWLSLRDSIKTDSKDTCFKSALSVCDVSGSMNGTPMEAAIGLTFMTMSFSKEPWSNICLTFSQKPSFVYFEKNQTLYDKVNQLKKADWGMNTDLSKTFRLILDMAKRHKLQQSEMPKYLFIFTDMEFDQACCSDETNFEEAKRLFVEAGYKLPTIIFWNLRNSYSVPIQKDEKGTILLSGYSAKQLRQLLNQKIDDITPLGYFENMLVMEEYKDLVVVD